MADQGVVRVPEHVLTRIVDGELVLLNLDNEQYYGLDAVATMIWRAVTTAGTMQAALQEIRDEYDVDEEVLARDVATLLEELTARGLVELDSP